MMKLIDTWRLNELMNNPSVARKQPYQLFVAWVLYKIRVEIYQIRYSDEEPGVAPCFEDFSVFDKLIDETTFNCILESCAEDIISFQQNSLVVKINDKPYRVPKSPVLDYNILTNEIFKFKHVDVPGDLPSVHITRDCIYTVPSEDEEQDTSKDELKNSRKFFKKIVFTANHTDDGWELLTDMEAVVYMWAVKMAKHDGKLVRDVAGDVMKLVDKISEDIADFTLTDIVECWNKDFKSSEVSVDSQFSVTKVMEWNDANMQKSIVQSVDDECAENFWYDKGRKIIYG